MVSEGIQGVICCIEDQVRGAGVCFDERNANSWHGYVLAVVAAYPANRSERSIRQSIRQDRVA